MMFWKHQNILLSKELKTTIKIIKNSNPRCGSEIFLKEIMSNCEIKKLVIDMKGYVDD